MTKTTTLVSLLLLSLASAGCFNRTHLTDNYGRAYRQAFERQAVNPNAGASAKAPTGLDALEASIVVDTYRTQLSQKAGSNEGAAQQMILVSPNAGQLGYSPSQSSTPPTK
jgi:hypothetical protein